ncbi:Uncharacterized protein HZ326_3159 [Fusarium oxysporum f. sp. albedinis]|nr:Uncharacterized protein HZ326_3159 [Fusarium oxysporum f. sp. albedinis]
MQDRKGEHADVGGNDLNHFSQSIFMCPVYKRQQRADRKTGEEQKYSSNAGNDKWHGREYDGYVTQPGSQGTVKKKQANSWSKLKTCTPECPAYYKDPCLAHERRDPEENPSERVEY